MKKKNLFLVALASLGLALSVGVGLKANKAVQVKEAEATVTQDSDYYFVGSTTSWADGTRLSKDSENDNLGQLLSQSMTKGDLFKFKKSGTWDGALGYSALEGGTAKSAFKAGASENNIEVAVTGTYHFYITSGSKIYVEFVNSATVYLQVSGWEHTYLYVFDETTESTNKMEPFGGWPGSEVTNVTTATNFDNSLGGIGKVTIPYHTLANTKIILTNNSGSQSGDQTLAANYYYWNDGNMGSDVYGAQAKVVFDIDKAVDATAHKSVCEISKATATSLLAEYDALSTSGRVDNSRIWTWNKAVNDEKINHTYAELIPQLRTIAAGPSSSNINVLGLSENTNVAIIIATVATISLLGLGAFFFIRKKKEN